MIHIKGYDEEKMHRIGNELLDEFDSQEEIDDIDEFFQKNAPKEYLKYCEECHKAREEHRKKGILA